MFYEVEVRSHVRVPPRAFSEDTKESVMKGIKENFENYISKDFGIVLGVTDVISIGDGIIIAGDGAAYYDTVFKILTFNPEMHEIVLGKISDVTDFGAFIDIGPVDGMIHISQTMDDFVSYNKAGALTGKESKRTLKVGDLCRARIIAVSYKDINNPKVGLTMRQPGLGKLEWLEEEVRKEKKETKEEKKEKKR